MLGVVVAGIVGVAYYTYTASQALNTRVDTCDQEINQLKVKFHSMESIFAKPPLEDLAPMFNLTQQPKPFDMTPQWTKVHISEEGSLKAPDHLTDHLTANLTNHLTAVDITTPRDPWLSSEDQSSGQQSRTSSTSSSDRGSACSGRGSDRDGPPQALSQ